MIAMSDAGKLTESWRHEGQCHPWQKQILWSSKGKDRLGGLYKNHEKKDVATIGAGYYCSFSLGSEKGSNTLKGLYDLERCSVLRKE